MDSFSATRGCRLELYGLYEQGFHRRPEDQVGCSARPTLPPIWRPCRSIKGRRERTEGDNHFRWAERRERISGPVDTLICFRMTPDEVIPYCETHALDLP